VLIGTALGSTHRAVPHAHRFEVTIRLEQRAAWCLGSRPHTRCVRIDSSIER